MTMSAFIACLSNISGKNVTYYCDKDRYCCGQSCCSNTLWWFWILIICVACILGFLMCCFLEQYLSKKRAKERMLVQQLEDARRHQKPYAYSENAPPRFIDRAIAERLEKKFDFADISKKYQQQQNDEETSTSSKF